SDSFCINFDMRSFFENYLILIKDEQDASLNNPPTSNLYGSVPDVVPFYRYGNRPSDPSWGLAFPQIVYTLNQYYNLNNIMNEYMSDGSLLRYKQNLDNRMPTNGIKFYPATYGDW